MSDTESNGSPKKTTNTSSNGLSKWLSAQGILPKSTSKPKPKKVVKVGGLATGKTEKPDAKPTRTPRPDRRPSERKGAPSRSGGGRPDARGRKAKTSHDPWADKPTHDKRDAQHITNRMKRNAGDIRVVPLGGMEQVGMNSMFFEWGDDIVLIDTGFLFPDPEHLGIDVLVPDVRYLVKNKHKIKGIIYTHGHLDHIGAVPYMVPELGYPPMYATKLTKELILSNSGEFGITKKLKIMEITPKSKIKLGKFQIEFFHVNHSIPDGVGIVVKTPYGSLVHTSDFKIDHNPSDDQPSDLARIAEIGREGVALAMVDSTNAMKPGHTKSEHFVESTIAKAIEQCTGRMIITTFASSVGRIAKVIEAAERNGRTVFLSGRSMENNVAIARKLNYLKCKDKTLRRMSAAANKMEPRRVLILSTGSQGEELAALTRMAAGRHKDIKLKKEDTILFSSSPIPGNETAIVKVKNNLAEIGLKTIDHTQMDVYVSGHGYQEELKTMTALLNPKYFAPIHGELYMRHGHRDLVVNSLGFKRERTFIMKNGQGVVVNSKGARLMTDKERIPMTIHMYELGRKVPQNVLQERQSMADCGHTCLVVSHQKGSFKSMQISSRGDGRLRAKSKLVQQIESTVKETLVKHYSAEKSEKALADLMAKQAQKLLYERGKEQPIVDVILVS